MIRLRMSRAINGEKSMPETGFIHLCIGRMSGAMIWSIRPRTGLWAPGAIQLATAMMMMAKIKT